MLYLGVYTEGGRYFGWTLFGAFAVLFTDKNDFMPNY